MITTVTANGKDEYRFIEALKERSNSGAKDVSGVVSEIINNVKLNGDKAVYDYTVKFDGKAPEKVEISSDEIEKIIEGCDKDYIETLKMYSGSAQKKAEEIEKYWAEKDIKNTTIKVHALKSASRSIGALELGELAARLEEAGKNGDLDTLDKELEELLSRYRQLANDLEPLNKREE